ncbi:pyridoxal phosphate-dependent aminotransferase [Roseateles sp. DXS20W]|uniref:Pyridoxal phosphate-dependent aminotransferase n=1 Tax=Pelomonas lactea TaxID=3299030 RepID=A0ABW7GQG4_9BURK
MMGEARPFSRMYRSFELFGQAAAQAGPGREFLQMSAGANWLDACPSVVRCLHAELDSGLTYRSYGRSAGMLAITDALAHVERRLAGGACDPQVLLVNGTTEGARLVFELLFRAAASPRREVLIVGPAFPLYAQLCVTFGLPCVEVLSEVESQTTYLPDIAQVVSDIERRRPALVCLVTPNNPIGERYGDADIAKLAAACLATGTVLLVDRVCMLPWDDPRGLARATATLMEAGLCFIVDSFSKSESLAGMRTGFIVANASNRDLLMHLTRSWWLNPVVFSTLTLAMSRLAVLALHEPQDSGRNAGLAADIADRLGREFPTPRSAKPLAQVLAEVLAAYPAELSDRRMVIEANHQTVVAGFGAHATRALKRQAGFNVALTLPGMHAADEMIDQALLAHEMGIGVLTESCFRVSERTSGNYFVRLGLTLPMASFARGVDLLRRHYLRGAAVTQTPTPMAMAANATVDVPMTRPIGSTGQEASQPSS